MKFTITTFINKIQSMGFKVQTEKKGKKHLLQIMYGLCRIHKHDNKIFTDHMNYLPENASQQHVF